MPRTHQKPSGKKASDQQKHIQSRFIIYMNAHTTHTSSTNASEHPLNLACEINEPDNKSLHINFYRFDCGKIGSGKTTKSQSRSRKGVGTRGFSYSSTTDNQMRIMDRFCGGEREEDRRKNIISSWILE